MVHTEAQRLHKDHNAMDINALSREIIDCAIQVHKKLGPGLLETVYQRCLIKELHKKNISCETEVMMPVYYDDEEIESGFRCDLIVDDQIIIELKSVEKTLPVHKAQTLTYLKLSKYKLALLINFGEALLKTGVHRFIDGDI